MCARDVFYNDGNSLNVREVHETDSTSIISLPIYPLFRIAHVHEVCPMVKYNPSNIRGFKDNKISLTSQSGGPSI